MPVSLWLQTDQLGSGKHHPPTQCSRERSSHEPAQPRPRKLWDGCARGKGGSPQWGVSSLHYSSTPLSCVSPSHTCNMFCSCGQELVSFCSLLHLQRMVESYIMGHDERRTMNDDESVNDHQTKIRAGKVYGERHLVSTLISKLEYQKHPVDCAN